MNIHLDMFDTCTGSSGISSVSETAKKKLSKTMNRTNDNIGWAQYSWNPVTGCNFGCPYCYAKEITNRYFGGDFSPKFLEDRLPMPGNTRPKPSDTNSRVFVCSMGELFGDWVPQEWIDRVMKVCGDNPQWTFLFLTKNPKRLPTIRFPKNAWIGATVDTQAREADTAVAMESMRKNGTANGLFISCEPLLGPVELSPKMLLSIDLVIIGAKSNGATKEQPETAWVERLFMQARENSIRVWFKDNLVFRPQEEITHD